MKRTTAFGAAIALSLAIVAVAPVTASAQWRAAAAPEAIAASGVLPTLDVDQLKSFLNSVQQPLAVLVVADPTAPASQAESVLAHAAPAHPELRFVKMDASGTDIPDASLPALVIFVPGIGPTAHFGQFKRTSADVDAFLTTRAVAATDELTKVRSLESLTAKAQAAVEPFNTQMLALNAEGRAKLERLAQVFQALDAQAAALAKPYNDQVEALMKQAALEAKPFTDKIAALKAQIEAATNPYQQKAKPLIDSAKAAAAPFLLQLQAAQAAGDRKAFNAAKARADAAVKPFQDKLAVLISEAREVAQPLAAQLDELQSKVSAVTEPYAVQGDTIRLEGQDALLNITRQVNDAHAILIASQQPFKDREAEINTARVAALGFLPQQIEALQQALSDALKADQAASTN